MEPQDCCVDCGRAVARSNPSKQPALRCTDCRREHRRGLNAKYRAADPERYRQYERAGYARNADRRQQQWRDWYWRDPDPVRDRCRRWHVENRERSAELKLAWNSANRERARETARAWGQAHPDRVRQSGAARRARKAGATVEAVDHLVVFERDGWVCQLCFEPVDRSLRYPDPECATLDHVVPLERGGEHSYGNTQLAHSWCNNSKGAVVDGEQALTQTPELRRERRRRAAGA